MKKFIAIAQIGFAIVLYLLSAVAFVDYMYSLTIRDTVTAIENAFGTLVILVAMLVLAKFTLASGRQKLGEIAAGHAVGQQDAGAEESPGANSAGENGVAVDTGQDTAEKGAEK